MFVVISLVHLSGGFQGSDSSVGFTGNTELVDISAFIHLVKVSVYFLSESSHNIGGLEVVTQSLIEGDQLASGHILLEVLSVSEALVYDGRESVLNSILGWLAYIESVEIVWDLS